MNEALLKTLELLLIIFIGYLLQKKLHNKESIKGVKVIILSVALPATIFLALLKIQLDTTLLFLPFMALAFNLIMFGFSLYVLPLIFKADNLATHSTRSMLMPSLAPGLSCFPFIMAYLGDEQLAIAALADVGNKFFGLILLFLVATYWYQKRSVKNSNASSQKKLKDLGLSLLSEPINVVIVVAIILLIGGFSLDNLPIVLQSTIKKFSVIMIPLILLFIGLSVRINRSEFGKMIQLLSWRSGVAFILSGFALLLFPTLSAPMALVLIAFPQSSCSFWPFAHMCTVSQIEEIEGQLVPTFDQRFAINMLACSLPFSTMVIISIFYAGNVIVNPVIILSIGIVLIVGAILPKILPCVIRLGFIRRQSDLLKQSPLKQ